MIINLKLTLDYNQETEECKVIKVEQTKKEIITANNNTSEPQLVLDSNKFILNQAAADLLKVKWEDRIAINYQKVKGVVYPVIGTDEAFGSKGGNKLTKSLTVSCRGKANEMLARYGHTFTLIELKGSSGIYVLIGEVPIQEEYSEDITIKEDETILEDDSELIDETVFEL